MDPGTIASGCIGLLATVTQTIIFIRSVIDAPKDQEVITSELANLENVVRLLQSHSSDTELIPPPIQSQILSIISSCQVLVNRIHERIAELKQRGVVGKIKWVVVVREEVDDLRASLEAHRGSLALAVQMVSIPAFKAIRGDVVGVKEDTTSIRGSVEDVRRDVQGIEELKREMREMRELVAGLTIKGSEQGTATAVEDEETLVGEKEVEVAEKEGKGKDDDLMTGRAEMLQRYLDNIHEYTESMLGDTEMASRMGELNAEGLEKEVIVWYGQLNLKPGQHAKDSYFAMREKIANANYWGEWGKLVDTLRSLEDKGHVGLINCWRIWTGFGHHAGSGFNALHQAAWHGASQDVVQQLLDLGAWKLSRTLNPSDTTPARSTAYDIARSRDARHLLPLLNPVIHRPLSNVAISNLQRNLHDLIKGIFTSRRFPEAHLECFRLPELEVLTEFERAVMWFPLEPEKGFRGGLGVEIELDAEKEELGVTVCVEGGEREGYRVSMEGVWEPEVSILVD
ncbi:hypothetical protein QBC34DRAFT_432658 [Podospora aff. communis PSN243]|uniref:Fungal N-terminal domain-containing protein n=1 Tax=Podospora aff. communis PSN243 TaxID=3040156 RepID=A0AAV9H5T8_9PEZI|nr:hypothetical protein QBC34DRAFT_432658 [Podospora aff. communis PSN243]